MSLLDHPDAQALLADAVLTPKRSAAARTGSLTFLQRYLPLFYRAEQRTHATLVIRGLLSGLRARPASPSRFKPASTASPSSTSSHRPWDDEAVMAELRGHVREELGEPRAILILDPSGFPKSGTESCGVAGSGAAGSASSTTASRRLPRLRCPRRTRTADRHCTCPRLGGRCRATA